MPKILGTPKNSWARFFWDRRSRKYFNPATVEYEPEYFETDFDLSKEDLLNLSGAPKGSTVTCSSHGGVLDFHVVSDLLSEPFRFQVLRDDNGALIANLSYLNVIAAGKGLGARMMLCVIKAASKLNFARLEANALAGAQELTRSGQPWVGALFVAKLGFDAVLPASVLDQLPQSLSTVRTLQQLTATPDGASWWSKNLQPIQATFDLSPHSWCMKILHTYTRRKGIRMCQCFTHPSSN